jgi:hypothetical protein
MAARSEGGHTDEAPHGGGTDWAPSGGGPLRGTALHGHLDVRGGGTGPRNLTTFLAKSIEVEGDRLCHFALHILS